MSEIVRSFSLAEINLNPDTTAEEVLQNVAVILSTLKGCVPLDRGLGLSGAFIDKPLPVAKALFVADIMEAVSTYEPRAEIEGITFDFDEDAPGKLIPIVEVSINE